jgi:hypothetical protein
MERKLPDLKYSTFFHCPLAYNFHVILKPPKQNARLHIFCAFYTSTRLKEKQIIPIEIPANC